MRRREAIAAFLFISPWLVGLFVGDYQYVMTAALIVTLPMLILFAFAQRYFVEGIATQGGKG